MMDISSLLNTAEAQLPACGQPLHTVAASQQYYYPTPLKTEDNEFLAHTRRLSLESAGSSDYYSHGPLTPTSSLSPTSSASSTPRLAKRRLAGAHRSLFSPYPKPQKNPKKNDKERKNRAELSLSISMIEKTLRAQNPQLPLAEGWKILTKHNSDNRNIEPGQRLEHNKQPVLKTNLDILHKDYALLNLAKVVMSHYDPQFAQVFQRMIDLRGRALAMEEILEHERHFRELAYKTRPLFHGFEALA